MRSHSRCAGDVGSVKMTTTGTSAHEAAVVVSAQGCVHCDASQSSTYTTSTFPPDAYIIRASSKSSAEVQTFALLQHADLVKPAL